MPTTYPPLSIGARARLAIFKREAANGKWARPMTWRDVRFATLCSASGLDQGFNSNEPIWYTHDGEQFRRESRIDEMRDRNFGGWYSDPDGNETAYGIIVALPHGRYLAGYYWDSNGERVYFGDIHDSERDACYAANEHARVFAETERDYRYRERDAYNLRQQIEDSMQRLRECIALRHNKCMAYIRDEIGECIWAIRRCRETLESDYADIEV